MLSVGRQGPESAELSDLRDERSKKRNERFRKYVPFAVRNNRGAANGAPVSQKGSLANVLSARPLFTGYSKEMERAPLNGLHPVRPTELLPYGWKIYLRGIVKEAAHQCEILGELIAFTPLQGNAQQ